MSTHHRSSRDSSSPRRPSRRRRDRRRRITVLALSCGGLLSVATALLGVSFAASVPPAPASPGGPLPVAAADPNCTLTVPAQPLTATGLATPYTLTATDPAHGPCHESDVNQSAFVQATVLDPATGALSVYDPLVTDKGTAPAVAPVLPALPRNAVVGIWFGFNGSVLTLSGGLANGACVNGSSGQPFGQFAYCDAPAFFAAADAAEQAGRLTVPPLGTGRDGRPCLTTRDFGLVDQDQSDNVTTEYLVTARGRTAQRTAHTSAVLHGTPLLNGSDNLLLTGFEDPALGCTPWTAPDLADPGSRATSLGLDELQAAKEQAAPVALVPLNDPMVLHRTRQSRSTTDLYRAGVDQPRLGAAPDGDGGAYCAQLATLGTSRIALDRRFTVRAPSPQNGQNLFDFLTQRLAASLINLGCPQAVQSSTSPDPMSAG
ncbi:hypothetical protein P3T36_004041 [Kitasatospora sp. MAP12-15]|uniref:hypothetical protein n=1 Tax=unclassified Kitasatospora TaxID=2633591 RepID=UPI002474561A|nr:hypothetical protein [Kitasatospora sp. MAP12-44]MDH6115122.1 hypothetical protein [Kitasatospora sp. MAP12-44]